MGYSAACVSSQGLSSVTRFPHIRGVNCAYDAQIEKYGKVEKATKLLWRSPSGRCMTNCQPGIVIEQIEAYPDEIMITHGNSAQYLH